MNTEPARNLTEAQRYAADISITGRDGELVFTDEFTGREMSPGALVPVSDLGTYDGQPVMEGDGGRLVYNIDPESADGCLIPVPGDFLGMPRTYVTEISVPDSGDGGVQRLHNHMKEPEDEPEPQA